ncbi:MAG TPA: hypothetical protein V6C99_00235 [Oculatellaceae cyanobacterium]
MAGFVGGAGGADSITAGGGKGVESADKEDVATIVCTFCLD